MSEIYHIQKILNIKERNFIIYVEKEKTASSRIFHDILSKTCYQSTSIIDEKTMYF